MAGKRPGFDPNRTVLGFTSGNDMTTNQYCLVQLYTSDTVATLTGTANTMGSYIFGVQENLPLSGTGQEIRVCVFGQTLAVAGEALSAGAKLIPHTNSGYVFAATGTVGTAVAYIIGTALRSASEAGQIIPILLYQGNLLK